MQKSLFFKAFAFLAIGSATAFIEILSINSIDSILPNSKEVKNFKRLGTITILSRNYKIIQTIGPATREKIKEGEIPLLIKEAFISAEDKRFYKHKGIDFWSILRALTTNIREREIKEGASTITQQLARIVYLSQDKTITRKIKEIALAYKLERQLSKDEILEQYINNVYLGSGAYGIADAAWVYFSKTPDQLALEEIAMIAGLAPAPSLFSPLINPELAIKRREIVLERMRKEKYISKYQLSEGKTKPLSLKTNTPKYSKSSAPFFSSWVFTKLPEIITQEQIEQGGLTIISSLDLNWQQKARDIITNYSPRGMEAAIVSIEPKSGLVRVLIGGKDFESNQFNRATQALRSPGSTFKIFTFTAALHHGIKPLDIFLDAPMCWHGYCPKNFGEKYLGEISLVDAFRTSSNVVSVKLLDIVGFDKVITTANRLGVGKEITLGHYYPMAIGAYEETLLNMTGAYAGITNRGLYFKPNPISEVRGPNNELIWSNKSKERKGKQVISQKIADTINWMLQVAVKHGTGSAASLPNRTVAGKTGTSEGNRDLWFIGSIPQLSTGIWFGKDNNQETSISSGNAAWAWKQFMRKIDSDFDVITFPLPSKTQAHKE